MGASAVAYGGSRGSTIYVFQAIDQPPFLEVKQTLPVRSTEAPLRNRKRYEINSMYTEKQSTHDRPAAIHIDAFNST